MGIIWTKQFNRGRDLKIRRAWEAELKVCGERLKKWVRDDYWTALKPEDFRKLNAPRQ